MLNTYAIIILATLLVGLLLELISNLLNLSHLKAELPEEFKDIYDQEKYEKSQAYTRRVTKFGLFESVFDLLVLLVFWFMGGFDYLDNFIRQYGHGELLNGLAFIFVLMLGQSLIKLPFKYYSTFVIEEEFGFNKMTHTTFVLDLVRGLLLGGVLGGVLLTGVLYFFIRLESVAWLYCWVGVMLFTLAIQYITPIWIMPLFNKFTPLEEGELHTAVMNFAKGVNFTLSGIYVIDGSKRSSKSNAFFTGFGKNKRIALYDTLVEQLSVKEMVGVLAHEIGHYKKKHLIKSMVVNFLQMGVMFYLLSFFLKNEGLHNAFFMSHPPSVYAGLIFFGMLYSPISMVLSQLSNLFSRKHEYEADAYSKEHTAEADCLIGALKKLSLNNLSNLTPHPFYVSLNYSHPTVMDRIKTLRGNG